MAIRIGVTTSLEFSEQRLRHGYVRALEEAGALPIIAPLLRQAQRIEEFAAMIDGLVIPGGPAITLGMVGTLPEELERTDALRLDLDTALLRACAARDTPVLGICYGMQLMNAVAGGAIYADVERQKSGAIAHSQKRGARSHPLLLHEGSHLRRILGASELRVNSHHLQAILEPGAGFRVAATGPDGVIEAIENESGAMIGVQFHPERMGPAMRPLFAHFVACARRRRKHRSIA